MPRQARGEYPNPNEVQIVHAVQRCVCGAFLYGKDVVTEKSFEHRATTGLGVRCSQGGNVRRRDASLAQSAAILARRVRVLGSRPPGRRYKSRKETESLTLKNSVDVF